MKLSTRAFCLAVLSILPLPVTGAVVWSEGINGDLSTNEAAPTPVTFQLGSNIISGSVMSPTDPRDYITFTLPAGFQLVSIKLLAYDDLGTGAANDGNTGFNAINAGSTSYVPGFDTAPNFLGGNHLNPTINADLLAQLEDGIEGVPFAGFTAPLGAGTYSYVVQQTGPQQNGYTLEFNVVPEPASGAMILLTGMAAITGCRRRNQRS